MSRYLGSVCKLCRREKEKLFLKGERCSSNCALNRKRGKNSPGQHGASKVKMSDYAKHLREKQKARRMYGLTEEQFSNYYKTAEKMKGSAGDNLLKLLELRLDNVVYRLGLASSKKMARQIVNHGNILVNEKKIDVPRYRLKIGDVITFPEKYKSNVIIKKLIEKMVSSIPAWLSFDKSRIAGTVVSEPLAGETSHPINSQLIVEYYSK
ncbi:30S ribosomal protein S4 A [Endomicrobiia bacterium]|uniref:Small ribosomal subunit protein uS4 n=1 Tax=Endomicrobium trichonymphae TaxID=1408204 RepID=RS4_ENDTX|nr:30S ribosomal protein S4 [Candidatus Endomicrobium trichonymphae]B1GZA9.1 RecName: Full=Small ribosomal subunit protein uS4; AltName: Full=30S ribosomal protein S4 [Candidatus Endomicrobium trichonymphae]GHT05215.1 30S ribosomal protein S4 A [Endomicrobiia bacterium]BAG13591.1 30S ribosomal protein S4 [Candidatus Endomicrobium trichonymphae]BAV58673.1 30S ribosomal protein S4 [Candidatus Endomicrobium trichonymphae]GHT10180.1 30S ribosomal protein S4 A [Endomicrobiia bacterium]GHT14389.1 3